MINIEELHKKQKIKMENKMNSYESVLRKCHNRINYSTDTSCFFEIPEFVFGVPIYNSKECVKYVVKKLLDSGFMVIYTHPNLLFISWQIEFTAKKKEEKQSAYKMISDYKPTGKFLEKLNIKI